MALKDEKFESFLKRSVDVKISTEVKAYDQAVVLSKTESHAFRFVAVSNLAIHIIDNPPKSILYSIPFSKICNVKQIHDTAKFLQKDLQDVAQHVVIKHFSQTKPVFSLDANTSTQSVDKNDMRSKNSLLRSMLNSTSRRNIANTSGAEQASKNMSSNNNISNNNNVRTSSGSLTNRNARGSHADLCEESMVSDADSTSSLSDVHTSPRSSSKWLDSEFAEVDVLEPLFCTSPTDSTEDLHVYVLNMNSLVYPMLKTAWRDYLLNATWEIEMHKDLPAPSHKAVQMSMFNALFGDLKKDIIQSYAQSLTVEEVYKYIYELKQATEQYKTIKKLFWQDGQLLAALGRLFAMCTLPSHDADHADGLECCMLIIETLSLMIRENETHPNCQQSIQQQSSSFYDALVKTMMSEHLLPNAGKANSELSGLYHEYFGSVVEFFFHLVVVSEQAVWNVSNSSHHNFTSHSLFSSISGCKNMDRFLDLLMKRCVNLWVHGSDSRHVATAALDGPRSPALAPTDCVRLYRSFVLLQRMITKIPRATDRCRSKFKEEFKYYIRPDSVSAKVPDTYPVCAMLRHVVHTVACFVLGGRQGTN